MSAALVSAALVMPQAHAQAPSTTPVAASGPALVPALGATGQAAAPAAEPSVVSSTGQQVYAQMRPRLLQVRTLLKTQDSQSSVGSGFLVSEQGHLITNYHVISAYASEPGRHRLVYASIDGKQGALQLLAFDVVHDLALLKLVDPAELQDRGAVQFRPVGQSPARGSRIFSLGNPLDVGFAVAEGTYNGLVERAYLPTLFFGGSLSPGMSGGPTVDEQGLLVGINVAARRDGEQVSFLVPADLARELFERGKNAKPIADQPSYAEMARQLALHQAQLTDRFIAQGWRPAGHAQYKVPVPQETFMRCWGRGSEAASRGLQFERSDCVMDSRIFISGYQLTGYIRVRHETYDGSKLGALRFAKRHSSSFSNEHFGADTPSLTAPRCTESSLAHEGLPLRAVVCLRAYKKLANLYDLSVLVASLDGTKAGVQGRIDAQGLSFDNAQRLTRHYLDGFGWTKQKTASP